MVRQIFILVHRWVGLASALFLVIVGLTGSLLAFLPELERLIAPELFPELHGPALDAAPLIRRAEALTPGMRANTIYFGRPGTAQIGVAPLPGVEKPDFSQIYLDSATGEELGRTKLSGLPHVAGEIMPFIYNLHYNLVLDDPGEWILGVIALAWTLDCFIALYLTFPSPSARSRKGRLARWLPAWCVKWNSSVYRINFDLHRAGGLWLWATLLIFAWSSVFMDLNGFYTAATRLFSEFEQPMWARPAPATPDERPPIAWEEAETIGRRLMDEQARTHGFTVERLIAFYLMREKSVYEYRVRSSRDIGDKYGATTIHFDSHSGALVSASIPTGQRAGNTLTTWLVELHMANVFGLPYKIFVCILGVAITMLSGTGVYIWWKKRAPKRARRRRSTVDFPSTERDLTG